MKSIIVQTSAIIGTVRMLNFLKRKDDEKIAWIVAPPGFGKTTIATYLAARHGGVYYRMVTKQKEFGLVQGLLIAVSRQLDLETIVCRSFDEGREKLVNLLRTKKLTILIDESEKCTPTFLEFFRDLHDLTKMPIFFFGTQVHDGVVEGSPMDQRTHFHAIQLPTFEDAKALTILVGDEENPVSIADDLLNRLWDELQISRKIKNSLEYIEEEAIANQWGVVTLELWGDRPLLPDRYSMPDKAVQRTRSKLVGTK
jgi:hypothetical protein